MQLISICRPSADASRSLAVADQRLDIRASRPQRLLSCERKQIRRQLCATVRGLADHLDDRRQLPGGPRRLRARMSIVPVMTVSRLLKSWATPPVSSPIDLKFLRMRQPGLRRFPGRDFLLDALFERPGQLAEFILEYPALGNVHVDADQARRLSLLRERVARGHRASAPRSRSRMRCSISPEPPVSTISAIRCSTVGRSSG